MQLLGDVAAYTIVAGNPARVLRTIPRDGPPESGSGDPDVDAPATVTDD